MRAQALATEDRRESGFTLLELLIAMTLLGFMTIILSAGLRFGARAWERGQGHSNATNDIRLIQSVLRDQIVRIYPFYDVSDPLQPHIDFVGRDDGITFLAPARSALATAGRMRITLQGSAADGALEIVETAQPELGRTDGASNEVLLRHLLSLSFSYFGSLTSSAPPQWHDNWVGQRSLPMLVRIEATFPRGDLRIWPELIIAPRISADVSCILDPVTKYCRGR